ncbi:MAG: hypothetical protein J0I44_03635 [Microbacterium sp.]|uniref:hypothetical protein n=1 Tax=Microbacterium sp. TaxID=51671 RepID=UPI000927DB82|nr:hypothetical protein [Microbacterium sp.]OJU67608.1 MAG: hypothetical protein BGO04_06935 [Microbacterium sp. 70-38]MBN9154566.1 hypothetical protein [Microbacterium sp.]MBN9168907.1 hypothetical protein [Microbacterium sp.]MBN9173417.1 hypothetical protein [Microbacterium sp.]MBN9179666.1 hypothetical protein [Microbacterium sp.]
MRGKVGLVIGLAAGYVLGTRAGRERYEQIKEQAVKVWNLPPVQKQVDKAKEFGKSAVMALPNALWDGAVKVTKAASTRGTAGERLDAALRVGKDSADDIARAAEASAQGAAATVDDIVNDRDRNGS